MRNKIIIVLLISLMGATLSAQDFAVKSNLLSDGLGTVNLGVEYAADQQWTVDLSGYLCGWDRLNGSKWRHAYLQPEVRWWFCDQFSGHFLGLHLHGGIFNVGNIESDVRMPGIDFSRFSGLRYQGWFAGAGLGYGYAFILGEHWNLEAELGVGYAYSVHDCFECEHCGSTLYTGLPSHYWGLTKAALSLVYLF